MTTTIGKPLNRVEGRRKVTGAADYAADHRIDGLLHACGVMSSIARGRIRRLDTTTARAAPGVVDVLHHGNMPALHEPPDDMEHDIKAAENRPPFADETVSYTGQFVALVVAETYDQARWAAHLVEVDYEAGEPPALTLDDGVSQHGTKDPDEDDERGDPAGEFDRAAVRVDATYTTPVEVHNAMELHATTARWERGLLILHDSTQWVVGQRNTLAHVLGLDPAKVVVHAPFIGGGFGGKLFLWPHTVLAACAARSLGRPVKLVLGRRDEFTTAGNRPLTRQRLRLGADADGRLTSIRHDTLNHTSLVHHYVESCGEGTKKLYACKHVGVTQRLAPTHLGTPTPMRAPGAAGGSFALESAMDELAVALEMDPLDLRLVNLPERDQAKDLPWSSNHFEECLRLATQNFGWSGRDPRPGSMREGNEIIGWGLAAASWPSDFGSAHIKVELHADGTARVLCATQDIGTGTYTVLAQVVAEITGLAMEKIEVVIGDSSLPRGPISGGSMVTATVVPVAAEAARRALRQVLDLATATGGVLAGVDPRTLALDHGEIISRQNSQRTPIAEAFARAQLRVVTGEAERGPGEESERYSFQSFGAHCAEVRWQPDYGRLRVTRLVGAFDAGRIINRKTAENQILGSLVMGMGMALHEQLIHDPRDGRPVNANLADYLLPVHADMPAIGITLLDQADPHIGEFGAKGVGEVGITGVAAAIANAVYHATGRRIRDLPITIERLIT